MLSLVLCYHGRRWRPMATDTRLNNISIFWIVRISIVICRCSGYADICNNCFGCLNIWISTSTLPYVATQSRDRWTVLAGWGVLKVRKLEWLQTYLQSAAIAQSWVTANLHIYIYIYMYVCMCVYIYIYIYIYIHIRFTHLFGVTANQFGKRVLWFCLPRRPTDTRRQYSSDRAVTHFE